MTCIVCLEDHLDDLQVLNPCKHKACLGCIKDWIETCESERHDEAKCPHCRQVIEDTTCQNILGRQYTPKHRTTEDVPLELDEFTMTWLQENGARQCLNCRMWMTNEETNDALMCVCGFCYCWNCDMCAEDCDCGHDEVYDNLRGEDVEIHGDSRRPVATEEECNDFLSFVHQARGAGSGSDSDGEEQSVVDVQSQAEIEENRTEERVEEFIEEPASAHFTSLFEFEEEADADFSSILEWPREEDPLVHAETSQSVNLLPMAPFRAQTC